MLQLFEASSRLNVEGTQAAANASGVSLLPLTLFILMLSTPPSLIFNIPPEETLGFGGGILLRVWGGVILLLVCQAIEP